MKVYKIYKKFYLDNLKITIFYSIEEVTSYSKKFPWLQGNEGTKSDTPFHSAQSGRITKGHELSCHIVL